MISGELLHAVRKNLATRFERDLFDSSIKNIVDSTSPIRFNNFAYAIRELTRHILLRLAPNDEVLNSKWYKNETDRKKGISRKQRIYYAIHGGLLPTYVQNTLKLDVTAFHEKFSDIIDRLSKYTHIEEETFGLDEPKILIYASQTLGTLVELFDFIIETKTVVADALHEQVEIALINSIIEETFSAVDILATHHSLEDVHADTLNLLEINHQFIYFEAYGTIDYELQWGSNLDVSNGDGVVFSRNFPFRCKIRSNVLNPHDIIVDIDTIIVYTDKGE